MSCVLRHSIVVRNKKPLFVFQISLPNHAAVYMSVDPLTYSDSGYAVAVVDSKAFLALWRAEPTGCHSNVSSGNPETWRAHRKYQLAADGFSHGLRNPVPLADVSFEVNASSGNLDQSSGHVLFSNGITRTIWLLSNGCSAFPILCPLPGAHELHRKAAASQTDLFDLSNATTVSWPGPPSVP